MTEESVIALIGIVPELVIVLAVLFLLVRFRAALGRFGITNRPDDLLDLVMDAMERRSTTRGEALR